MEIVIGLVILCAVIFIIVSVVENAEKRRRDEAVHNYLLNQYRQEAGSVSQASSSKMKQASDSYVNRVSEITKR